MAMHDGDPMYREAVELIDALLYGELEPLDIALPAHASDSDWLDALEEELFGAVPRAVSAMERETIRREHAGFRIVRKLAADNPHRMAGWLFGRVLLNGHESTRVGRLVDHFRVYDAIEPGDRPTVTH